MGEKIKINDVELILSDPDEISNMQWIGGEVYMQQLLAAWILLDKKSDIPMNPQILGKPGVGKTTLAYTAAKNLELPTYIFQCTVDTRPEDLLISPVISEDNKIKYHASSLVSAMIKGGICILDEANRMSEKSWASLAPLLDQRHYVESIIAGIKIQAHPDFRVCVTMNDDSSTFEVPEYIHSRLQPQIFIDFPEREEEFEIIQFNLPYAKKELVNYTVNFLQKAHRIKKEYSIRDGINICRYYLKAEMYHSKVSPEEKEPISTDGPASPSTLKDEDSLEPEIDEDLYIRIVGQILGKEAMKILQRHPEEKEPQKSRFNDLLRKINKSFSEVEEDYDNPLESEGEENERIDFNLTSEQEEDDDHMRDNFIKDIDDLDKELEGLDEDEFDDFEDDFDGDDEFEERFKHYKKNKQNFFDDMFEKNDDSKGDMFYFKENNSDTRAFPGKKGQNKDDTLNIIEKRNMKDEAGQDLTKKPNLQDKAPKDVIKKFLQRKTNESNLKEKKSAKESSEASKSHSPQEKKKESSDTKSQKPSKKTSKDSQNSKKSKNAKKS